MNNDHFDYFLAHADALELLFARNHYLNEVARIKAEAQQYGGGGWFPTFELETRAGLCEARRLELLEGGPSEQRAA